MTPRGGRREGAGRKPRYGSAMPRVTVTVEPYLLARMDEMIAASSDPSSLVTYGGRSAFVCEALREYISRHEYD